MKIIQLFHVDLFLRIFFVAFVAVNFSLNWSSENVSANPSFVFQDDDFEVGDLVEIEFLGDTYEGRVTRFTGTGWPYVEFERRGRTKEQFFPPSRITLLQPAGTEEEPETPGGELRTWADATGKFEIKARLLNSSNGKIELKKADGRVVTLALEKLSTKDQEFIADLKKKAADEANEDNPFAGGTKDDNPFAGGAKTKRGSKPARNRASSRSRFNRSRSGTSSTASKNAAMIEPEFGSNEVGITGTGWSVAPDGKSSEASAKKIISLGQTGRGGRGGHVGQMQVAVDPLGRSLITMKDEAFTNDNVLMIADLAAATGTERTVSGKWLKLFAGSHDGKIVVMKKDRRGDKNGGLEFWNFSTGNKNSVTRWKTADFFDRNGFEPKFGVMLDKGRLLTFGRRIVAWDVETASDTYTIDIPISERPTFSPGGKQFAVVSEAKIYIVEVLTGKTLGVLDAPGGHARSIAFSDSGQFLVAAGSGEYETIIWDLGTGKQVAEFQRTENSLTSLDWIGDEYVLVNGTDLVDVVLKSVVWDYKTDLKGKLVKAGDGNFYYVSSQKITPVNLLPERIKEKTARLDPDELLMLKPGSSIAIKLSLPFLRSEVSEVRKSLSKMLTKIGYVVNENAPNELVIKTKKMKQEKMSVSSIHDPFGRHGVEDISFSRTEVSIRLNKSGKTIWQHSYKRGPSGVFSTEANESSQEAADRMCKVKPIELMRLEIPSEIRTVPADIKGSSKITTVGIL